MLTPDEFDKNKFEQELSSWREKISNAMKCGNFAARNLTLSDEARTVILNELAEKGWYSESEPSQCYDNQDIVRWSKTPFPDEEEKPIQKTIDEKRGIFLGSAIFAGLIIYFFLL